MATFTHLNVGWNADPNAPEPNVRAEGTELLLTFYVNAFQFPDFIEGSKATVRFKSCSRYRLGPTNDEGWYRGQCRFSGMAPSWGEFYRVAGDETFLLSPTDWVILAPENETSAHYLFYLRDETFECRADSFEVELPANNSFKPTSLGAAA